MWRRPGPATLLAVVPLILLWLYGVTRAAAPFGLLGLLFHHPWDYGLAAAVTAAASAGLMGIRRVDRTIGRWLTGAREPQRDEQERLERLLAAVGEQARIDAARFHLLVQDDDGLNAAAGGRHLIIVTRGALRLPDDALSAVLAHELGHHRELLPIMTALIWWSQVPALPIRMAARAVRRAIVHAGSRLRSPFHWLTLLLELAVLIVQVSLLWLVYVADVLAAWVSRTGEFAADRHAAEWGFAGPLAAALVGMSGEEDPQSRLERLLDDYPPVSERVQRLDAFSPVRTAAP